MAATTTTIAGFRRELVDLISTTLPTVQVEYGAPVSARSEVVYLGATVPSDHQQAGLKDGRRHRREDYTTLLRIEVASKVDYPENEARCVEIAAAIESALANDHTLGGAVPGVLWVVVTEMTMASAIGPQKTPITTIEMILNTKADLR